MFLSREMRALAGASRQPAIRSLHVDPERMQRYLKSRIDALGEYRSPDVADVLFNSVEMALIASNFGGGIQTELKPSQVGGRERVATGTFAYAAQASGSTIWITRLTIPCRITGITLITDTSTATATLAFGDANTAALFVAAAAYTAVDTPTRIGKTSAHTTEITVGYDAVSGVQVTYANNKGFGALYEDVIATVGTAALPASGNLCVIVEYVID